MKYTIGIIEDNPKYRTFLIEELNREEKELDILVWKSGEDFLNGDFSKVDILLLDINLPHMSGVDLLAELQKRKIEMKVIVLSAIASEETIFRALKNGAIGYASKLDNKNIHEVIQIVLQDGAYISPSIAFKIINYLQEPLKTTKPEVQLTPKEQQILRLIVDGETALEIANTLGVVEATIRFHIKNIYKKLQVKNRIELLKKSESQGYLKPLP